MSDYGTTKQEQQSVWKVLTRKSAASYMKEETVKVPVHYRKIGAEAFKSNIKMETLMLPNGMLEIGADAFRHSKLLREAALPHSIWRIGSGCFAECPALRVAYIPNSLECISEDLFKEDRRLQKVLFTKDNRSGSKRMPFTNVFHWSGFCCRPSLPISTTGRSTAVRH